ncbi:GTP-binding protein LepA [Candidatus Arthromitus sp. SFB-mouse-Japan]|uniref:translation elongation factor 4 n=1 Tax=Candidatus Arthromitus sp. SFB-mouse TaxID=49118 RepID=UPI00021B7FC0|nr:translation elongation factor 4 [Candidatus Arthromitus sp. SFB-mouse]EIA22472.1 GTP-binding protein lepA [Candidatus Arthromitus sp. SFB-1]EIA26041.1 GTP-binding protein LepA [Candidatus Arthromitus sp. SFB-5]EIA28006.1 GTP-binding protein lepA [Candidatus Arthromitus sp. SFB-co]EIA30979.1 GTP-binding protein lepA [Candidatus Arthromitus sp. SFB-mouse-SU]EGX28611.1 GTP-binding protein [Candidatus Arthromitus sp. SFB-mouse-NYU]
MNNKKQDNIRNFCIIAHIDHGKSTLADRLIEITGTLTKREMEAQVLDNMELEKERGITIKSQAVRLIYTSPVDNEEYILNLIDTPGHVDFNYEVSRSLAACEGAILVVDASQGIQAQTLANCYLASDAGLEVVPVLNKVDLPSQRTEEVREEIEDIIGIEAQDAPAISAKTGLNIGDVLETIVRKIPKPRGNINAPLKALVFDSMYDSYRGVICYIRVKEGYIKPQMKIRFMFSNKEYEVTEVGIFTPSYKSIDLLQAGEVGYVTAAIKNVKDARVGDTITSIENPASEPLEGYKSAIPTVFSGIYPIVGDKYDELKEALEKLQLNDAALIFEPETSLALGFGFRCGFLGLLHMEIVQERLEREFNLDIIITAPSVIYKVNKTSGNIVEITNPYNMPKSTEVESTEEPIVNATIITPSEFVGGVMELCQGRRANFIDMQYLDTTRVILKYVMPLNEIIYDFFDTLKSKTKGYASFDYELSGYQKTKLVKLDILLNGNPVDALSMIVPQEKAYQRGKNIVDKLKTIIPRQLFEIPIQAAIGAKIIARETVKAVRKDVLSKCYGGDITRKKKLLEKQKEGKKRMRQVGSVEIPQEAFISVLKVD